MNGPFSPRYALMQENPTFLYANNKGTDGNYLLKYNDKTSKKIYEFYRWKLPTNIYND